MVLSEYDQWDATTLARLLRAREVSLEEVLDAAFARIHERNPDLNAVIYQAEEAARASLSSLPDGPFRGVPILLKDLLADWQGHPMTLGSRFMLEHRCTHDSWLVARFKAAGMVPIGRTNVPELGILGITEPAAHGPTRNPWHPSRTAGGSSGGAGAAVASRMVPVAHGGDGGGSLRIPASYNGLLGFKPSRGRVSLAPDRGESWGGLVQEFALLRSVQDCATLLEWVSTPPPGEPYHAPVPTRPFSKCLRAPGRLRIAVTPGPLLGSGPVEPTCLQALSHSVDLLRGLGHLVEDAVPSYDREAALETYFIVMASDVAASCADLERLRGRKARWSELEPATWFLRALGESTSAAELVAARRAMHRLGRELGRFFEAWDVLVTPTVATLPPEIGALSLKPTDVAGIRVMGVTQIKPLMRTALRSMARDALNAVPNTQLFNLTGQPALSLPLFWTPRDSPVPMLPIGTQLVGRYGDEATLLQLAWQLEQVAPWADRIPRESFQEQ